MADAGQGAAAGAGQGAPAAGNAGQARGWRLSGSATGGRSARPCWSAPASAAMPWRSPASHPLPAARGLRLGQPLAEATRAVSRSRCAAEDAAADRNGSTSWADWCEPLYAAVACDRPDGLLLDINGCAQLFGGEASPFSRRFSAKTRARLACQGGDCRQRRAGRCRARFGACGVIAPGEGGRPWRRCRSPRWRLEAGVVTALHKLGLRQIVALQVCAARAAPAPFSARISCAGSIRRWARRASRSRRAGRSRPFRPSGGAADADRHGRGDPVAAPAARRSLPAAARRAGHGRAAVRTRAVRVDGIVLPLSAGTSAPLRSPARIAALFSARLANPQTVLDAGFGFEIVRLNVLHDALTRRSRAGFRGRREKRSPGSCRARLSRFHRRPLRRSFSAVGTHRESHLPERRHRDPAGCRPLLLAPAQGGPQARPLSPVLPGPIAGRSGCSIDPPELMEAFAAEVPDGPPRRLSLAPAAPSGAPSEVPERIAPEWWRDEQGAATRDYFRVEDEEANASGSSATAFTMPPTCRGGTCIASSHEPARTRAAMARRAG